MLYHLVSGHAWFTAGAVIVVLLALELSPLLRIKPRLLLPLARVLLLTAIGFAGLSGTPVPLALLIALLVSMTAVLARSFREQVTRSGRIASATAIAVVAVALAVEARWHQMPEPLGKPAAIVVLGDSLSSGGFGEGAAWPTLVERATAVPVTSLASPGETVGSALQYQVPELNAIASRPAVLIELGGNDLLGETSLAEFDRQLDALLGSAVSAGDEVLMFELPLPPARWLWGSVQRRVSRRHGVAMIPKRVLARVVSAPQMVSDGLHPTDAGHRYIASVVAPLVGGEQ